MQTRMCGERDSVVQTVCFFVFFQIIFSFVAKCGIKMMSEEWFAGLFKSLHTPFTRHVVDS